MTEYLPGILICSGGILGILASIIGLVFTLLRYGKRREELLKQLENE